MDSPASLPPQSQSWDDVPTAVLQAQLARRQDTALPSCGSSNTGTYNTSIHVFALVLILLVSVAGSYLALQLINSR
jgi:hypothetical protein